MTLVSERPRAGSNARTREGPSRELLTIGALLVFGLVALSPVLNARFVLVDDHEILSLVPPIGAPPGVRPLSTFAGWPSLLIRRWVVSARCTAPCGSARSRCSGTTRA